MIGHGPTEAFTWTDLADEIDDKDASPLSRIACSYIGLLTFSLPFFSCL